MTRAEIQTLIDAIADDTPNTALEVRTVLGAIADGTITTGTVVVREVATAYISTNFDPTGLGINIETGYAIMNGNNGTRDWRGRVPMQYSASYPTLGATGGSATHTLTESEMPAHTHTINGSVNTTGGSGANVVNNVNNNSGVVTTNSKGGTQAHNNMQPYLVTLFLMKL